MIIIAPPESGAPKRYGWHWSVQLEAKTSVGELANRLVELSCGSVYLVLSLVNDKYSKRWALVTNGNVIAWQRTNCMRKA
jgi:hypothetical protein